MEVVPDKGGATVKKRGVFRGGSRKRSPTAEAGMRLVRRRGLGGAGEEALESAAPQLKLGCGW